MPRRSPVLVLAAALGAMASLALVSPAAAQMSVIVPSQPGPGVAPDPTIGRPAIPVRPIYPRPWPPRWGYPRPIPPYQSPDDPWRHDGDDVHIQPWPYPGWPVREVVTYGTGISVGGRYDNGALRLALRVGAPIIYRGTPWSICNQGNIYYWSSNRWNHYNLPWYRQAVFGTYRGSTQYIDPALTTPNLPAPPTNWTGQPTAAQQQGTAQPTTPPEPPTAPEIAVMALRARQPEIAVRTLRHHLRTESGDARSLRLLAVALLETRDFDDASSVMRLAYRTDPGLAAFPLDFSELGYAPREARSLLVRTVTYANRVNSASGLLSVAVLMQGEGRAQPALNVLTRAARAGLEPEVLDRLRDELGN